MRWLLALAALPALVAGCGGTTTEPERALVVQEQAATPRPTPRATPERGEGLRVASARIAMVSHGQASDPFWAVVKKGLDDAARQTGVAASYRAPDTYDVARMRRLIDEAIRDRLDGLVVSLPDVQALRAPIRRAERAGIPVVSINSGSDRFRDLGILAHVGQPEYRAGFESGRRMAAAGVRLALCVNQEEGNAGLAERCRGFGNGMQRGGGEARELIVDLQDPDQAQQRIAQAVRDRGADGVLTLGTAAALPALDGGARRARPPRAPGHVRHLARCVAGGAVRAADVRRRPAAVPSGLPADRAARRALAAPARPAARRADPDRAGLRHARDGGRGARAQPPRLPLSLPAPARGASAQARLKLMLTRVPPPSAAVMSTRSAIRPTSGSPRPRPGLSSRGAIP